VDTAATGPVADTALVTRLVVVDAVLLGLGAAYAAWVSRTNRGSRIKLFSGHRPPGRERWAGTAVIAFFLAGVSFGTAGYSPGTRVVNILVFLAALAAVSAGGAALHNRAVDRR